ncbi:hypothetical protein Pcinc_007653 [Petrolisthes cinctipes]|uniref:NACHT domain-containing protein n=1 Tax=Petrolisthes cinctipes TaxID=88211 RepID=A0AAE1G842_PETCI|nr:hypothetical protein Pcinc_007653 [Petrolisthes cinctipes]
MSRLMPPTHTSMDRNSSISDSIVQTFQVACSHLSRLNGRSIDEYCEQENVKGYIFNVFNPTEKQVIISQPQEEWNLSLLYKVLRYASGLASREDPAWNLENNTFESCIKFVYTEYKERISEAARCPDQVLNDRLDLVLTFLVQILTFVECQKNVDLSALKKCVQKDTRNKSASYQLQHSQEKCHNLTSPFLLADQDYVNVILAQKIRHRVFVMAFKNLNCLKQHQTVSDYLRKNCKYQNRIFTPEENHLLQNENITPENMPIVLVYKLLRKVCGLEDHTQWATSEYGTLEYSLYSLYERYGTIALMKGEVRNPLYKNAWLLDMGSHVETVMKIIGDKTGKSQRELIEDMPEESQYLEKSLESLSLPTSSRCPPLLPPQLPEKMKQKHPFVHKSSNSVFSSTDSGIQSPLTPAEMNIASLHKILRPGGIAVGILCTIYSKLNGDIDTLLSETQKKLFTSKERQQMSGDLKDSDITFMFKLLRFGDSQYLGGAADAIWITKGDSLEYIFTCIKNIRNKFAHETTVLPRDVLEAEISNIENLLENALRKTGEMTNCNLQKEIDDMKEQLKLLPRSFDLQSYEAYVKDIRDELSNKMVVCAQKEQQYKYRYKQSNMLNSCPVTWTDNSQHGKITIDKIYVDVEIMDANEAGTTQKYSLMDLLDPHDDQPTVSGVTVIQGVAGIGKTSLCKYIIHLYCLEEPHPSLKDIDMIIHIPCRYVTASSLVSYLKSTLPETFGNIDNNDIMPMLQDPRVLVLVDGYEEATQEAKALWVDVLYSLPDSRIIVTCRPQWVPKLVSKIRNAGSSCQILKMVGFSKEGRSKFVKNLFEVMVGMKSEQMSSNFLRYMEELEDQLNALTRLPLTLALLALLWIEDSNKAKETKTVTQLYKKLTYFMLKRLESDENADDHDPYWKWVIALGSVAWENMNKNKLHLSDADVRKLKCKGEDLNVNGPKLFSSLLHCETDMSLLTDSSEIWTFKHNYQQEYFSAEYITDVMIKSEKPLCEILGFCGGDNEDKRLQRLTPVIEFVSDLLYCNEMMSEVRAAEILDIILAVQAPWSFTAARKMFQQLALESPKVRQSLRNMFTGQKLAESLEGYDPESVEWILEQTSLEVPKISFEESCFIHLKNSTSEVLKMGPLLKLLATKNCKVEVSILLESAANMSKIVDFMQKNENVYFVMVVWHSDLMTGLINVWPWSERYLRLYIPQGVLPLLWWELEVGLMSANMTHITIYHSHVELSNILKNSWEIYKYIVSNWTVHTRREQQNSRPAAITCCLDRKTVMVIKSPGRLGRDVLLWLLSHKRLLPRLSYTNKQPPPRRLPQLLNPSV